MNKLPFIFLFIVVFACKNETKYPTTIERASETLEIQFAKHFNLIEERDQYTLKILNPTTKEIESIHIIDKNKDHQSISLSSTVVGMYAILNAQKSLKGISSIDYVYDTKVKALFTKGEIDSFGDETTHSIEKIIKSTANTILYSGFGDKFPNQKKLEALHFNIIPIYDWKEVHPLGKAEWIKVVGALTGKMDEAIRFYNQVVQEYKNLAKLTKDIENRPTCLSGNLIGDIWYTPASESYPAILMKDAGADYRYSQTKGNVTLQFSIEQILKDNEETDFWINPGYDSKVKIDKFNPHIKHLKCYENIFCYSSNMNKFWEQSAAEPNHVLSDLIHLFHPEIKEIDSFYYYTKIE